MTNLISKDVSKVYMLMINICKTKVKGARFEIYAAIGVSLRSEDVVSSLQRSSRSWKGVVRIERGITCLGPSETQGEFVFSTLS